MIERRTKTLLLLLALYLVTRLTVLLFLEYRLLMTPDDLAGGAVAKEIIKGPFLPLFQLQAEEYCGGVLVTAVLTVPFFLLLGDNYFALRLVALLFSTGILGAIFVSTRRFAGPGAAIAASLLYVFCPPFLLESQLATMWHLESALFILGSFYFFLCALYGEGGHGTRDVLLAGLLMGFGIYFLPSVLIALILILCTWWVFDKAFILRGRFWLFALSLAAGVSPFLVNLYRFNLMTWRWLLRSGAWKATPEAALAKMYKLFTVDFPASFSFQRAGLACGMLFDWIYYAVIAAGFLGAAWAYRRSLLRFFKGLVPFSREDARDISPMAVFLLYPALYLAVYAVCRFRLNQYGTANAAFEYRYLAPVMPFLLMALGVAFDKAATRSCAVSWSGVGALAVLCALGAQPLLRLSAFAEAFRYRGYSYCLIGQRMEELYSNRPAEALSVIYRGIGDARDREECIACYTETVAEGVLAGGRAGEGAADYAGYVKSVGANHKADCYRGLGRFLAGRMGDELIRSGGLERWQEEMRGVPEQYQAYCYEGLAQIAAFRYDFDRPECLAFLERIPPQFRAQSYGAMERQLALWNPPAQWRNDGRKGGK